MMTPVSKTNIRFLMKKYNQTRSTIEQRIKVSTLSLEDQPDGSRKWDFFVPEELY